VKLGDVPGRFKELINRAGEKAAAAAGFWVNGRVVWEKPAAKMVFFLREDCFWRLQQFFLGGKRECCCFCSKDFLENNW